MRDCAYRTRAHFSALWGYLLVLPILSWFAQSSAALDLVGYVPYYSFNSSSLSKQIKMLDEVRYFGLTVASNGSIVPQSGSGTLQTHTNNIATIKQMIDALPAGQRPRLDITFGGAGESANFATIAGSSTLRATFAQNIQSLLTSTGATAVDIDWETPDNSNAAQLSNYATMLQQIKHAVGSTNRVYATTEPQIKLPKSVVSGTDGIDGISLMTYDLSWWANDAADPNRGEHSLPQYVIDSVDAWTAPAGSTNRRPYVFPTWGLTAAESQNIQNGTLDYGAKDLGIGMPLYGRVIGTSASPQGGAAYAYSQLVAGGTPDASGNYYTYQGQTVWIPGPSLAEQRVQFANDRGLQQLFFWEMGQDLSATNPDGTPNTQSLLARAFLKNETLKGDYDGDRGFDAADFDVWRTTLGSTSDLRADGNGNGIIDSGDYVVWRKHMAPPGAGSIVGGNVPEPTTLSLMLIALIGIAGRRRSGNRR
jgi:GH18 family chitinase